MPARFKAGDHRGNFKCLRVGQRCKVRHQQAYHRYRFHCANGRLRRWSPSPPPPPEPPAPPAPPVQPPSPPPPPALTGHYKGATSANELIEFDVIAGPCQGASAATVCVTNFHTGQMNQGCTPPFYLSGGYINTGTYKIPVNADGSFGIQYSETGTVGPVAAPSFVKITGAFSASLAAGTVERKTEFTWTDGVHYSCGTGPTWTAART